MSTILYQGVTGLNDSGDKAMTTLYEQWYNAVVAGLRLDPSHFQLLQPNTPLGNTSNTVWAYFNSIPPNSLLSNFQLNGLNQLYADYRAVVSNLKSPSNERIQQDLGDSYQPWITYLKAMSPLPTPQQLPQAFFNWATINAPDVAAAGRNDYEALLNDPIGLAQTAVLDQSGFISGTPNFSQTIADLRAAVQQAPAGSFDFDSSTASSDTSKSWASGVVGGFWDFFEGEGSGDWESVQSKASSSGLTIAVSFDHVLTFSAVPGNWYSSAALGMAYSTRDNTLWEPGHPPSWETTFGPTGNMQRFLTSLVVADGIQTTMSSSAAYSTSEQEQIKAQAEVGFFPFFFSEASGGHTSNITFDDSGSMKVETSSPAGNPVVIGANVFPASGLLTQQ